MMKKLKKTKKNNKEFAVCCRTWKEHHIMLVLVVYIQHVYRKKFWKKKKIPLQKLLDETMKILEQVDATSYPF